jgi:hypothetical protein
MNQDIVPTSVRIEVADSFLLVVYIYRIKMIPKHLLEHLILLYVALVRRSISPKVH